MSGISKTVSKWIQKCSITWWLASPNGFRRNIPILESKDQFYRASVCSAKACKGYFSLSRNNLFDSLVEVVEVSSSLANLAYGLGQMHQLPFLSFPCLFFLGETSTIGGCFCGFVVPGAPCLSLLEVVVRVGTYGVY